MRGADVAEDLDTLRTLTRRVLDKLDHPKDDELGRSCGRCGR